MLEDLDTRAVRRAATKERILKAAWRLARKDGLTGFSLRDVAKAVGMRAPSLYSYFDSKNGIYDAMFAQGNTELLELMSSQTDSGDFVETFKEGQRRFFRFATSDPVRHQLMMQRTIPNFEPSPASYAIATEVLGRVTQTFEDAGITDPKAIDLWTAISGGLVTQQIANDPGGDRWEVLIDGSVEMFLKQVGYRKKGAKR